MTEANNDSELTVGDKVIHDQYGTGEIRRFGRDSKTQVDFTGRGSEIVKCDEIEAVGDLLHGVDVDQGKEWADEAPSEWESPLYCGEVRIDLDFAENVEYDVDVHDDGHLVVQYWEHQERDVEELQ